MAPVRRSSSDIDARTGFASSRPPDLVWQETVSTTYLIDQPMRIREYSLAHGQALDFALDRTESLDLIEQIAKEFA